VNPFNGIESYEVTGYVESESNIYRIHSMELKVNCLDYVSGSGLKVLNPFNGIERKDSGSVA